MWWGTAYDECLDLLDIHRKANGAKPDPSAVEDLHEFDREQIAALKAEQARTAK